MISSADLVEAVLITVCTPLGAIPFTRPNSADEWADPKVPMDDTKKGYCESWPRMGLRMSMVSTSRRERGRKDMRDQSSRLRLMDWPELAVAEA